MPDQRPCKALFCRGGGVAHSWEKVASLIEPGKLATLGKRGANQRVQKCVAQLAEARAVALAGMKGEAAALTAEAMVRGLKSEV